MERRRSARIANLVKEEVVEKKKKKEKLPEVKNEGKEVKKDRLLSDVGAEKSVKKLNGKRKKGEDVLEIKEEIENKQSDESPIKKVKQNKVGEKKKIENNPIAKKAVKKPAKEMNVEENNEIASEDDPAVEISINMEKEEDIKEKDEEEEFKRPISSTSSGIERPRRSVASKISYVAEKKYGGDDDNDGITMSSSSSSSESDESEDEVEFSFSIKNENRKHQVAQKKRGVKKVVSSSSSIESDESEESLESDEGEEKVKGPSKKKTSNKSRGGGGGGGKGWGRRKKPTGNEKDEGDMHWPKCRNASIKRKTGNPEGSNVVKSGLRMVTKTKPDQPWKKNLASYERDRKLAKGERRMREYRLIAEAYAYGKVEEVSYDECFKVHEEMKKAYHEGRKLLEAIQRQEKKDDGNGNSSSDDEWEEMEQFEPTGQEDNIEVTFKPHRRGENDESEELLKDWWVIYLRQEVNKRIRNVWENTHKTHLLCYMYHLVQLVKTTNDEQLVPSLMVSQLPSGYLKYIDNEIPNDVLTKLLKWYCDSFPPGSVSSQLKNEENNETARWPETRRLVTLVNAKCVETDIDRAALLFALLVGMGNVARIVVNLRTIERKWDKKQEKELADKMEKFRSRSTTPMVEEKEEGEGEKAKKKIKKKQVNKEERNYWVEYWNSREKRWICLDPFKKEVDEPLKIQENATSPMSYVFAVDNKRGICDVSQRYALDFVKQDFRRRRTDPGWLASTLRLPIFAANEERKKLEKMQMHEELVKRPLPTTISEYKNHPLYVLEKDLLKFEAIYPPTSEQKPLGTIRGNPVYPRSCVFTLQGENNWLKLARSVKIGEKAYKMVKARPDPRVPKEDRIDQFLEVFGYWQTEPYRRPTVEKGKIPVNAYGNVYMFNECMCPIGCVYLKLPGLVQISRKLKKECVPAVVGWAFDGGWTHPVIDGAVVLEKDAKIFVNEWEKIEEGKAEKEEKKRKEKVMENWRKMICGMLRLSYVRKEFGKKMEVIRKEEKMAKKSEKEEEKEEIIDNSKNRKVLEGFSLDDFLKVKK